ncbi:septum formation initiator family protein [Arthrobacter sp. zg-Y20]|nr:septum formation initiator family protein [Arthrobacter sp. zg-Y20]
MVMVAITVLLAPSVRTYLQQRSDIAAARAEIAQAQEKQSELEVQLGRWEDPAYIKQQARDRIFLVMPGEKRYLVKGENGVEEAEAKAAEEEPEDLQWVDSLWDSVKRSATAQ